MGEGDTTHPNQKPTILKRTKELKLDMRAHTCEPSSRAETRSAQTNKTVLAHNPL